MYGGNSKKTILIIDDDPHMLMTMKTMLQKDYEVYIAPSGPKGIRQMERIIPDLVLLDYNMPEVDGKETFETIKRNSRLSRIPVMFLTGVDDKQQAREVLKLLPAGYVLKPPIKSELIGRIEKILGNGGSSFLV